MRNENLKLRAELEESIARATEVTGLKELVEEESTRLKVIVQRFEMENRRLQQQVQTLLEMTSHFKSTTLKSIDEFAGRLKLDLDYCIGV